MTEVERRTQVLLGNVGLENGLLDSALKAFEAAGAKDELIALGSRCLGEGRLYAALKAFEAAGEPPPTDKLLALKQAKVPAARGIAGALQRPWIFSVPLLMKQVG
jgi:hypothetical protein